MENYCIKYVSLSGKDKEIIIAAKSKTIALSRFKNNYKYLDVISIAKAQ